MDLAKIGEIVEVEYDSTLNELLGKGWVLVGFVERQYTATTTRPNKSRTVYILGKPRERPKRLPEMEE